MGDIYRTSTGRIVQLGAVLGRGGEGIVKAVQGDQNLAAKIYHANIAAERRDKVLAMADAGWHKSAGFVAYPIEALFETRSGTFAGFTMRKVGGHKAVHQLYSPTGRKTAFPTATYPLLIRAVSNVARAMASVHATGCVVGDINHSSVLVASDATVTFIDSDSFQVNHAGRQYACQVGVPEFTPPELQGQRLDQVVRTANHDAFGLAVLVFYTLIMGRHPFAGRFKGSGDMPMDRAIREFRFAYSARSAATQMDPPPHVPTLKDMPLPIAEALERAFGPPGAMPAGRPSAEEWVLLLDRAEAELSRCNQNSAHHYFRTGPGCPWCRMEQAYPGFSAFVPTVPPALGTAGSTVNLGQLIAAMRGIPDPGAAPDLSSLMPQNLAPAASQNVLDARQARMTRWGVGGAGAALGITLLLGVGGGATFFGWVVLAGGAALALNAPSAVANLQTSEQRARTAWKDLEERFRRAAGNENFGRVRRDGEALVQLLQALPGEETRRLAELDAKRRDGQMRRHLERFAIDRVRIKGIGNARKLTLKSYGIETAADVSVHRIEGIHGFGPSIAQALLGWRRSVEAKFVFDPRQPIDPKDIAAVRADIAKRRSDAEGRLRQTIPLLQKAETDARSLRANPGPEAAQAWAALKQSEADSKALNATAADFTRFVGAGLVALALLVIGSQFARKPSTVSVSAPAPSIAVPSAPTRTAASAPISPPASTASAAQTTTSVIFAPAPIEAPARTPSLSVPMLPPPIEIKPAPPAGGEDASLSQFTQVPADVRPLNLLDRTDSARIQQRLAALGYLNGAADGIWGPRSRTALREFRRTNGLGLDDRWDIATQLALLFEGALRAGSAPAPINLSATAEASYTPPEGAMRNPLNRLDALWAQARMRDLGFYAIDGEGVWGPASRDALRDFKAMNGLPADDVWDATTEQTLGGIAAVRAAQTFVGGFAASASECSTGTAGQPPINIGSRRAEAFGGVCNFDDVQRDGANSSIWRARGQCTADGKTWRATVRLTVQANTVVWTSERGSATYYRCR